MKKLLLLIATITLMAACANIDKNSLEGKWKEKEQGDVYVPEGEENGTIYDFKKDGTYSYLGIGGSEGKYEIEKDKIKINPEESNISGQKKYYLQVSDDGKELKYREQVFEKVE